MIAIALAIISLANGKEAKKEDCSTCTQSISMHAPISDKKAHLLDSVVEKISNPFEGKWKLKPGDHYNCPEYLEFYTKDNSFNCTEYYGMNSRKTSLVRSTRRIVLGVDKITVNMIIKTSLNGKVLHQTTEELFPFGKKSLVEDSVYTLDNSADHRLALACNDRHNEVKYKCDYEFCLNMLCTPENK